MPRQRVDPRVVLAIASLGAAVAFIDATIVNIAFPNIERSFRSSSISSLSWVLNAYNIVFASFLVAAGRLADVLGRRRVFLFGLELFTLASLLCALAPSATLLIAFRVVQALGAAALVPAAQALVLNAFPPERRSHGTALMAAVAAGAAGLGPSIGGLLVAAANWRLVFLVNLPIGGAAVILARRRLVESRAPGRRRLPDLLGASLFAVAIAAVVLGVVKGQQWGWGSPRVLASFIVGVLVGAAFIWRCSWHRVPVIDLSLLRIRTFSAANAMTVLAAAGFYGYTLTNVLFLTGVWRYSVLQAGLALTPGPFVAAAVAGPSSRLVTRIGHRPVLVAGGLIWGAAVLWLVERVGPAPAFLSQWLPGIVLLGIGAGMLLPNLSGAAAASAPGDSFGAATGINSVSRQVGAAFGVAIVVAIIGTPSPLQAQAAFQHAWTFGAAALFASGLGCLLVGRVVAERSPSLASAARLALSQGLAPDAAQRPRARRAVVLPPASEPSAPGAQSAAQFLAAVPLFAGLERSVLEALAAGVNVVPVAAGEWLFHEGEPGDALFLVRSGRLEVVDEAAGSVIRELGRGDALGELALLTDSPRSASVRAVRASELLAVGRPQFDELLHSSTSMALSLNRVLAEQLRQTRAPVAAGRPLPATVALLALDERVGLDDLGHRLVEALARHLPATVLDPGDVRAAAQPDQGTALYGPLLDRAEAENGLVVLIAGSPATADTWTDFALSQADRILVLACDESGSGWAATRPELKRCDLVALNVAPGSRRLAAVTQTLEPIECHLVRDADRAADLARLARRLTGRSLGIVLSGGGARAFAHIGVLEELTAAGVTIDRVAGVSMGAYVGALFAMGLDPDEIDARCFAEWVQRRPLADYTLPRHALIRGERFEAMLHRTFAEVRIEELATAFTCGCAELRSGSLVIQRVGPLWEAVGLSMCLPIIGPPQIRGRQLLVDGSLVDNLPVASMAELGEGPIIAVDVKAGFGHPGVDQPRLVAEGAAAQAGGVARSAGRTGAARLPSLGETLTRVLLLGSADTSQAASRHADVVIEPRPDGVGLFEFHQIDAAREAGRAAARDMLESPAGERLV